MINLVTILFVHFFLFLLLLLSETGMTDSSSQRLVILQSTKITRLTTYSDEEKNVCRIQAVLAPPVKDPAATGNQRSRELFPGCSSKVNRYS